MNPTRSLLSASGPTPTSRGTGDHVNVRVASSCRDEARKAADRGDTARAAGLLRSAADLLARTSVLQEEVARLIDDAEHPERVDWDATPAPRMRGVSAGDRVGSGAAGAARAPAGGAATVGRRSPDSLAGGRRGRRGDRPPSRPGVDGDTGVAVPVPHGR